MKIELFMQRNIHKVIKIFAGKLETNNRLPVSYISKNQQK